MSFSESVNLMPDALRLWVLWLTIVMVAAPLVLLIYRKHRQDGLIVLAASVIVIVSMQLLYGAVGFVRLLGLPHVLVWTPLLVYLLFRLRRGAFEGLPRVVVAGLAVSIAASLVFDYIDVLRYIAGDRAPMVPSDVSS